MSRNYEKRRFIEAACMAMIHAQTTRESYSRIYVRDVVNKAVELYDEIEHQVPNKENDRD